MRLSTSRVGPCPLVFLLSFLTAAGVVAQEFRGAVTGLVTDTSGGRLPGVAITATNVATNVASTFSGRTSQRSCSASRPPGRLT